MKEVSENDVRRMKLRKEKIQIFMIFFKPLVFLALAFFLFNTLLPSLNETKTSKSKQSVVEININKVITSNYVKEIIDMLESVRNEKSVSAVLLIMNSPGGSPSASDELANYLIDYQKEKAVKLYVESMAASGGYYIACAVKPIVANANAMVGSIGVVISNFEMEGLAKKLGIMQEFFTAGEHKVPISMFKKTSDKNKEYLKEHMLMPTYNNFLKFVFKQRSIQMGKEEIKKYAEGKVFIASDPQIAGVLVDSVSYLSKYKEEIKKELATKKGISPNEIQFIQIKTEEKMRLLKKLLETSLFVINQF